MPRMRSLRKFVQVHHQQHRRRLGANRQTYHYRLVFGSQQEVNVHRTVGYRTASWMMAL